MKEPLLEDEIAAARAYEALFVPALFAPWARIVVEIAQLRPGHKVLDVACGTGVLAREAARAVDPGGAVSGLDVSRGMLAVARETAPSIDWWLGTADDLPFSEQSFDVVLSQFGLMFFSLPAKSLTEMLRVLTPGGRVVIAVWDALAHNPAFADEVALVESMAGKAAAEALRAPFTLGDIAHLEALCETAGMAGVHIETRTLPARFPDFSSLLAADLHGWLPMRGIQLDARLIDAILSMSEQTLSHHSQTPGKAVFPVSAHVVSGHKQGAPPS